MGIFFTKIIKSIFLIRWRETIFRTSDIKSNNSFVSVFNY